MDDAIAELRAFNRFYTRFVGALDAHFLDSDLSLAEARLLYELANRDGPAATELQDALGMDAGYVSRIVRRFSAQGWIERGRGSDARRRPIALTDAGRAAFTALDGRQREAVKIALAPLDADSRISLIGALGLARGLLGDGRARDYSIRTFRTGDMGMIAARQSILYDGVYRWGRGMEVMIGDITTAFLRDFKPDREQCWVAEQRGMMAGAVFLVDAGGDVAQLRLLHVEDWARGLGIGEELVKLCIAFARDAGYREIMLWTHTVLTSARRIYAGLGFRIRSVEVHDEFGRPEQGETWAMPLGGRGRSRFPELVEGLPFGDVERRGRASTGSAKRIPPHR